MPTVLILSPHFPPSTLAGVHRARHLAKGLPSHGWRPVVLRVDPRDYSEPGDQALEALVSGDLEQVRIRTLPVKLTRWAGIGDIGLRGYRAFGRALRRAALDFKPDVVLLTGSPFYPLLLSRMVRLDLGLPVVLDFQDPWVSAEGALRRKWTKGWASHQSACLLEPRAVRFASAITSVSAVQNEQMKARYDFLSETPMAAIPIGGDPEDFVALRKSPPDRPAHPLDEAKVNLSFVGTFMPRSGPLMEQVFAALRDLCDTDPGLIARLRLNFVGTSNQPGLVAGDGPATALASRLGVGHLVQETPGRVPYLEALSILANSDGLLLIGSDEPHYTASKIYPALMSGTPYLSLFHGASSAHEILSAAGGGINLDFRNASELAGLVPQIRDAIRALASGGAVKPPNPDAYAAYTAKGVAGAYAHLFSQITARAAFT